MDTSTGYEPLHPPPAYKFLIMHRWLSFYGTIKSRQLKYFGNHFFYPIEEGDLDLILSLKKTK